jgi:ABC-type dipeptide/oligopeptide/nickel transport system permease component/ABC-type transport system substrate-binding protein
MTSQKTLLWTVLLLVGAGVFIGGGSVLSALLFQPDLDAEPPVHAEETLAQAKAIRDYSLDLENPPTVYREVDYSEGRSGRWWPKNEAPVLRELVEEGLLPPLEERAPSEPVVIEGPEGIGNYGGTWYRVGTGGTMGINNRMSGSTMVRWSPQGYPIVPHVAKGWDVSEDGRVYTFYLRKGMRWSDGHPFTADDILFWWEDLQWRGFVPRFMRVAGEAGTVEVVDDYTVRYIFPHPHALFLERLAHELDFARPRHYLMPYHPEWGDPELMESTMRAMRLSSPRAVYNRLLHHFNPEHPRLWPWVVRSHQRNSPYVFIRNPYYWAVDPEGNQLPYIDRVLSVTKTPGMIRVSVASGEVSMQKGMVPYEDYTYLMEQREPNNFEVRHWFPGSRSMFTIFPNLNRRIEPGKPETAFKHELLNDVRFRKALSYALNREQIIRAEYHNQVEPAQLSPGPQSRHHNERLHTAAIEYDPEKANRLLDELGLTKRDREGYRTFRDGTRMYFNLSPDDYTGAGIGPFLIDDWKAVGVRVILRVHNRNFWLAQVRTMSHDLTVSATDSEHIAQLAPANFVPIHQHAYMAPGFGLWYTLGGLYGTEASKIGRAIEPPKGHPLRWALERYEETLQMVDPEERDAAFNEILDLAADQLWHISVSSPTAVLVVVQNGFRNVPHTAIAGWNFLQPAPSGIETFFFDDPRDSPGAIAQVRHSILEIEPDPAMMAETGEGDSPLSGIIRFLVWGSFLAVMGLIVFRHPYIGRRLLIMIPTLLIISVITFTIIQLPPGDFLSVRIAQLEMEGDEAALQGLEELKMMFHYDKPAVEQYLRWLGVYWFLGFDRNDMGLLQGNLGRSMEDGTFVSSLVGDRILLTFAISFLTILFTWAFAIPAGIFSAVRQYSIADYAITFVGFIGMCIPNFLLALVLMYLASAWFGVNVSGLFSAEYVAQPEWTWGKVVDLMQHIWVPVIVLGTAGTAGMIRVMRANLLDELRKPYVVTARAKGVRPMKMLFKYPVRLALNPFISSIGGIFPQLVSGGAIVAMVLSLPTVGPLMLDSLFTQDMYLAGSMLMVLSLLGVLGTLVSDLLLLWLDPRIRLTGGTGR